jgi:hypothetical protein
VARETAEELGVLFAEKIHALLQPARADTPAVTSTERLRRFAAHLAEVYAIGLLLPKEEEPIDALVGPRMLYPPVDFGFVGPRSYFRHADPSVRGTEEVGDLGEDLQDIHGDLTRGLAFFATGTEVGRRMARVHWRRTLPHWGHHAVEAIRAIHYRLLGFPGE